MNAIARDVSDLHPSAALGDMPMLWTVLAVAVAAAAACAMAMTLYGRRRARRAPVVSAGAHAQAGSTQQWLARVDDVVRQYDAGAVTADEAYAHLAALTREFAAVHSGRALSTSTLRELERRPTGGKASQFAAVPPVGRRSSSRSVLVESARPLCTAANSRVNAARCA